jgi:UDP-3-O-[3-hydroxymyristoyl] glucosamine N-acyltransferase
VANPRRSFIRIVGAFFAPPKPTGVHPTAVVDPRTELGDDVHIGPFACVEAAKVGGGSVIHGHVHIYPGVRIGRNVTIHAGAVIGADGYGYERNEAGVLEKFPHLGGVVIEDEAEIGANACIDRGTLGDTVISEGAKIDDLVYVAHNVTVGRHAAVIALSAIAGGARIGDRAWIAPGATVRDKQSVGADARVGIGAAVLEDVPGGSTVAGVPARPLDPPTRA